MRFDVVSLGFFIGMALNEFVSILDNGLGTFSVLSFVVSLIGVLVCAILVHLKSKRERVNEQ